jgi:hypothetical protein
MKTNLIRVVVGTQKNINDRCSKLRPNVNCFGLTSAHKMTTFVESIFITEIVFHIFRLTT